MRQLKPLTFALQVDRSNQSAIVTHIHLYCNQSATVTTWATRHSDAIPFSQLVTQPVTLAMGRA